MTVGGLGAGAQPVVQDPVLGVRVLGLPARMPTVALALALTGALTILVAWLALGRRLRQPSNPREVIRVLAVWAAPLLVAPPMFSRDVYSYLAQSKIAARGLDPYLLGPAQALGIDHVLTRSVPTIWRDTPAPYEPGFVWIGRLIAECTGDDIVVAVLAHRMLAVFGVALLTWSVPRLARRCGVNPAQALWLGCANPLVLFHLVAGIHNDALMLGVMLVGLQISLTALDAHKPLRGHVVALLIVGSTLIVWSSAIKIPALLALGFVGVALARRRGGTIRATAGVTLALTVLAVGWQGVIAELTGLGFGWIRTLATADSLRTWLSSPTALGMETGRVGVFLGMGDHTSSVLALIRPLAEATAVAVTLRLLLDVRAGRREPLVALAYALTAIVLLLPVVQPWYALWPIVLLAAAGTRQDRRRAASATVLVCLLGPMPNGGTYSPFVILQAATAAVAAATAIAVCAALLDRTPWKSTDHTDHTPLTMLKQTSAATNSSD